MNLSPNPEAKTKEVLNPLKKEEKKEVSCMMFLISLREPDISLYALSCLASGVFSSIFFIDSAYDIPAFLKSIRDLRLAAERPVVEAINDFSCLLIWSNDLPVCIKESLNISNISSGFSALISFSASTFIPNDWESIAEVWAADSNVSSLENIETASWADSPILVNSADDCCNSLADRCPKLTISLCNTKKFFEIIFWLTPDDEATSLRDFWVS